MPNHIQNKLQIIGTHDQIKDVLDFIKSTDKEAEEIQIDFNKIIPMPDELKIETHSGVIEWAEICTCLIDFTPLFSTLPDTISNLLNNHKYGVLSNRLKASTAMESITGKRKSVKDFNEKEFDQFIQCVKNIRKHGLSTWYDWSVENWGTKWNAYQQNDERNTSDTIFFQTAWNSSYKIIGKLSEKFPSIAFKLTYADEDSGSNAGVIDFKNGAITDCYQPKSQSKGAYDLYFELHPDRINDYKLIGDTYEYIDEESDS